MKQVIDLSERPYFWLSRYHTLRNALVGIPGNIAMVNIQKYPSRVLSLIWFVSHSEPELTEKIIRINPDLFHRYSLERIFRTAVGHHPNFFTEDELFSLHDNFRPFNFGYESPHARKYIEAKWLIKWNEVHKSIRKDNYAKTRT
jgi:hypothetical protein